MGQCWNIKNSSENAFSFQKIQTDASEHSSDVCETLEFLYQSCNSLKTIDSMSSNISIYT